MTRRRDRVRHGGSVPYAPITSDTSALVLSEQIGGFSMETPARPVTAVRAHLALVPVEQVGASDERPDPRQVVTDSLPRRSGQAAASMAHHPSHPSVPRGSDLSGGSDIELRRRSSPITCSACQVTYLTRVSLPMSVVAAHWVCPLCLSVLLGAAVPAEGQSTV
jgi:hypothetical protein